MLDEKTESKILARVRKMMRLAQNSAATEGERDNALRMAHATLAKYNLELVDGAESDDAPRQSDEPREQHQSEFLGYPWAKHTAHAAATLFFCRYFYTSVRGTASIRHNFVGRRSNAVTAHEMAKYLIDSIHREARAYQRATTGSQSAYTSFATGAMYKIMERCKKLRAEAEAPIAPTVASVAADTIDRSMSLAVVYRNEEADNAKFLAALVPNLRERSTRSRVTSVEAMAAGTAYGARVSLNRQIR
jgi:hypothetical protein